MVAIKNEVGFKGDLPAFFAELRDNKDDPRYYYPNTDEGRQAYIKDATAAIDKIKAVLPKYFGILPKADLVVRRVEPFREQPGAAQHYFPSTPDGSRPGVYYAHLSDMKAMPKHELEVIAYHEGLPGHHMQIAIAQELISVPTFRRQAGFTAYSEGWGLYSEWLAREMPGTYQDPYSRFGRLGSEIWRAIRLVVDTGLHAKGWSEEQAVQYFLANSATTEAQARSEIRRYMVLPGQATSYKIGMLKIQELRRKAETALGARFDIRALPRHRARRRRVAADHPREARRPLDRRAEGIGVLTYRRLFADRLSRAVPGPAAAAARECAGKGSTIGCQRRDEGIHGIDLHGERDGVAAHD